MNKITLFLIVSLLASALSVTATAANITSNANGNWSATAWPNTGRTGTITTQTSSAMVTGAGTLFTTQISVGSIIKTTGDVAIGTVASITDNTHLTLTSNAASNNTAIAYRSQGIGSGDNVTVSSGFAVTIDVANAYCNTLTINGNSISVCSLTLSGTNTLTVTGAVTMNRPADLNVNAGTLNAASINITGGTGINQANLNITTGTVTVTGNISFLGGITSIQKIVLGSGTLNVGGTFEADGTLTAGTGTVNYTGTNQTIAPYVYNNLILSGSGTIDISDITVNGTLSVTGTATVELPETLGSLTINNSNGMTLSGTITVNGTLIFLLGNLYIGDNNLALTGSVTGASDGKCIVTNGTGTVSKNIAAAGSFTFPVGTSVRSNPVAFTSLLGGTYTASLVAGESPATANDAASCLRTWKITGTNPADITFTWNSADMGGSCTPSSCTAWRHNGTTWINMFGSTVAGTPNMTTLTNVTSFSSWTVGNSGSLPIELTSFTAALQGTSALLNWTTATETNNSGFQIERSVEESEVWVEVAFIAGAGTCSSPKTYSYEDKNLAPGPYVYRIKQVDRDGTYEYYTANMPQVDAGVSKTLQLGSNYPNPFNPTTNMQFSVPQDGYASLKAYNMLGQEVATMFSGMAKAGHYISATFNASRLASGIYFARLQYNGKSLVQRMLLTK